MVHPFKKVVAVLYCQIICILFGTAQSIFTTDDTLRGSITPQRAWWDVTHYTLKITPDVASQTLNGVNFIRFKVLKSDSILQIDLQPDLVIDSAYDGNLKCAFLKRTSKVYWILLRHKATINSIHELAVYYHGKPILATNPPWEGGFQWLSNDGLPYISTSCQGLGASAWWPCKDHPSDEPDSMRIEITAPPKLFAVSNGRLKSILEESNGNRTFIWEVKNPINNYGVNLNIADYFHYSEEYAGEKGLLSLDYYVLPQNIDKAKKQFAQVKDMLKAFEYWFGPYPFYEDGFKLVEVPYLGMEHQSDVSYGNHYTNGYLGRDLSGTGWGLKWDFIIVHESGHEWFGNNITHSDIAEMYIHEGFTAYSESLFTEYFYGKVAGADYVKGTRNQIANLRPLIGNYNVNKESSEDIYYKGANMLHTLRQNVNNDSIWRKILRGLNSEFYHQVVSTQQIEDYIAKTSCLNLKSFFNQYLRDIRIPNLEYQFSKNTLSYRWQNVVSDFKMPIEIKINSEKTFKRLFPSTEWQKIKIPKSPNQRLTVNDDFYITSTEITKK